MKSNNCESGVEQNQEESSNEHNLEKLLKKQFQNDFEIKNNLSDTHSLVLGVHKNNDVLSGKLEYLIYEIKSEKIILKDSVTYSKIDWFDNEHLIITPIVGTIKKDSEKNKSGIYYINIFTKRKLKEI